MVRIQRIDEQARNRSISAASSVVSLLMTGAFVLDAFSIEPVIPFLFRTLFEQSSPIYFNLALGAAGVWIVIYNIFYTVFFGPVRCLFGINLAPSPQVSLSTLDKSDFFTLILMFVTYQWVIIVRGIQIHGVVFLGGFIVILTSILFRVVPRIAADTVEPTCFYGIKIVVVSIVISALLFVPTMYVVIVLGNFLV